MKKSIKKNIRLGNVCVPESYKITLKPDLEAHTFSGEETIEIKFTKSTSEITLHSKDLDIISVSIISGKNKIQTKRISYDDKRETATFHFGNKLSGKQKLHIIWQGILSSNMRGFYKSQYEVNGEKRWMATTQFEATDARRAIPCFDEPTHKAVFHVDLIIPNTKTAISNTLPQTIKEHESGFKIVSFTPTPKMSTYLLAFIVGDFEWIEKKTRSGVLVRVLTVPGKKHQGKFALDVTVKCLEFYEKYFDIPYPLNTLDMIAIPDFSSLAMENWGAITFREIGLLVDEEHTSLSTRERVAEVIAHELAHQWFGNLVTMEWWTHLWLNEGFASYIPYIALTHMFPSWNMWERFATDTQAFALSLDALENTHPIEVDVHDPNEIGEIFDAVSYSKGASAIRMLADYIGEKNFRDGLRHYLKKHSYNNAHTIHLWDSFEKVSGLPVKNMMSVWTKSSGYPVLSVAEKNNKFEFSQKRFFSSSISAKKSKDKTLWPIPLGILTPKGIKNLGLIAVKKDSKIIKNEEWYKVNPKDSSLIRVSYSHDLLKLLQKPIRDGRLGSVERLSIIRDLFALNESGLVPVENLLDTLSSYKNETEYIVWVEIISGLRTINNLLSNSKYQRRFGEFSRSLLENIVVMVGWDKKSGDSHSDTLLRPLVLGSASFFGDRNTILTAEKYFANRKKLPIDADLRGVVYGSIARNGGEKEYKILLEMYRSEKLHEEKNRILSALGQFKNKKLLTNTLNLIMSHDVRMQDRNGGFASVLVNSSGRELGWKYIKKNWKKIGESYGDGNHLLSRLIGVLNRNTSMSSYKDIKQFFKTHSAPAAERTILQTLEKIESNHAWLKRDEKNIGAWLCK